MAARFWVGGTGNWNDTAHWSTTTGGSSGAAVPTTSDAVTIDSSSGSGTITINVAASAGSIAVNNVNITLSHSAGSTVTGTVTLTTGSLLTNGFACSWGKFAGGGSSTRTLDLTGSAISVTGSGTPTWSTTPATSLTLVTTGSAITFTDTSATAKSINSGAKAYGDLTVNSGSGTFTMQGSGSYGTLKFNAPLSVVMTASTTVTVTKLVAWGSSGNLVTFTSSTPGTRWNISQASGYVWLDWVSLTDSNATGGAQFYAGSDSTNVSNNAGWTFAMLSVTVAAAGIGAAAETVTTTAPLSGAAAGASAASAPVKIIVPLSGTAHAISAASCALVYHAGPSGVLRIRDRPPVRLALTSTAPSGATTQRWALDEPRPENAPSGLTFSTTMPGGFEQANLTLPRKPGLDYPDLQEFSDVTIRGVGGQVAWEGRIDTTPRTSGAQRSVSPALVGWQAHLDANENVQMIYVSQSPSLWVDAPLTEQIRLATGGTSYGDMSWASQVGGLVCAIPNQAIGASSAAELWFIAPAGVLIAKAMYLGTDTTMPAGWEAPALFSHSETLESPAFPGTGDAMTLNGTLQTTTCSDPHRAVSVRVFSNGTAATPASGSQRAIKAIGVYGNHGLTTHAISSTTPDGVLASDVVAHALATWAPLVNFDSSTLLASSFVIPHLVFTSLPAKVSDVITAATSYDLEDWAIWEDRTFYMNARGDRGNEWRAMVGPSGLQETGPQSSRIWNSTVVQYQDVDGTQRTVGPPGSGCDTTDATLVDTDPLNPANIAGETRRAVTQMGTSTAAAAVQIGARFLQEQKLVDTSGQAAIVGHVQDTSGVWWPAWKIRAGDTISFTDAHDPSPRRVVKTGYDDSSKTNTLSLDSPPDAMPELLARMSISIVDTGLS